MARLYCLRSGAHSGPTLMLVHPLGSDANFWDECRALWDGHFGCMAVDLRPVGRSPMAETPVTVDEQVDDLIEALDAAGVDTAAMIGCALGGMVSARLAARYPARVSALVLANPGIGNAQAARKMLAERAGFVRQNGTAALLPAAALRTFHELPQDERFRRYAKAFAAMDAERYALAIEGFLDIDISADLPKVRCPTLLVPGAHDVLMAPDSVARSAALLPVSQTVVVEATAHFVPYQAPETFARIVTGFLERLPL